MSGMTSTIAKYLQNWWGCLEESCFAYRNVCAPSWRSHGRVFPVGWQLHTMMDPAARQSKASDLMGEYARMTGLDPPSASPDRYLWTDAFAVCNYMGMFRETGREEPRDLALRLVRQVHHTLGKHRGDDGREGWISGLAPEEGELHPTAGGLRIGKPLPERGVGEPYDPHLEWDQDGQYYHYLTKWMHALAGAGRVTGDPAYLAWAIELARVAHARFVYRFPGSSQRRMYWKMSIDLSRPLVSSMGQHDPLDGLITYYELQFTAGRPVLSREIEDMAGILRGISLETDDPLGIGGLLFDASRIVQIAVRGGDSPCDLLLPILTAALSGLETFSRNGTLALPATHRLAFRELGLSIGLAGVTMVSEHWEKNLRVARVDGSLARRARALMKYLPIREDIERFWLDPAHHLCETWTAHRGINTVMLATSLTPGGFLLM